MQYQHVFLFFLSFSAYNNTTWVFIRDSNSWVSGGWQKICDQVRGNNGDHKYKTTGSESTSNHTKVIFGRAMTKLSLPLV